MYTAWDIRDKESQERFSVNLTRLWADLSKPLQALLRSDNILIIEHDFGCNQGDIPFSTSVGPALLDRYRSDLASQNVWLQALRSQESQETYVGTELVPNWELVGTTFYRRWLRPQKVLHALIGVISHSRERIRCLFALREASQAPFSSSDKTLLKSFLAELRSASEVAADIASLRQLTMILLDLFDDLPGFAAIVDESARPILQNAAAKAFLEQADGLALANGILVCSSSRDTRRLHGAISGVLQQENAHRPCESVVISREACDAPMVIKVVALQHIVVDAEGHSTPLAAVFVASAVHSEVLGECLRFYGMTQAETRLAAMIVDGRPLFEVARELHITLNTARTHMKRIYAKTETHSPAALLRLLMTSSRGTAAWVSLLWGASAAQWA